MRDASCSGRIKVKKNADVEMHDEPFAGRRVHRFLYLASLNRHAMDAGERIDQVHAGRERFATDASEQIHHADVSRGHDWRRTQKQKPNNHHDSNVNGRMRSHGGRFYALPSAIVDGIQSHPDLMSEEFATEEKYSQSSAEIIARTVAVVPRA